MKTKSNAPSPGNIARRAQNTGRQSRPAEPTVSIRPPNDGARLLTVGQYSPLSHVGPESNAVLSECVRQRVALFGDGRGTHTRRVTACHEAGHLLAHQLCGQRPKEGKIWRDPAARLWFGCSIHSSASTGQFLPLEQPELAVAVAFEWLAGACAEVIFGGVLDPGSSADEAVAAECALEGAAFGLHLPPEQLRLALDAHLWLRLEMYRTAGETLASALMRERKIKGKSLHRLLKDVPELGREAVADEIIQTAREPELLDRLVSDISDPLRTR